MTRSWDFRVIMTLQSEWIVYRIGGTYLILINELDKLIKQKTYWKTHWKGTFVGPGGISQDHTLKPNPAVWNSSNKSIMQEFGLPHINITNSPLVNLQCHEMKVQATDPKYSVYPAVWAAILSVPARPVPQERPFPQPEMLAWAWPGPNWKEPSAGQGKGGGGRTARWWWWRGCWGTWASGTLLRHTVGKLW